jgi:acetyl esterase/lipase
VAPATVVTTEDDPAAEDGRRYASRLREAGVEVKEVSHRPSQGPSRLVVPMTSGR